MERFVRPFVRASLLRRRGGDLEVVEAFDGGGGKHKGRKAGLKAEKLKS
jgi:hypothetical protein